MLGLNQIRHQTWPWCLGPMGHSQSTWSSCRSHSADKDLSIRLFPFLMDILYLRRTFLQLKPDNLLIIILTAATHHPWFPVGKLYFQRRAGCFNHLPCGGHQNWTALKKSSPSFRFGDISVKWVVIGHLLLQQLILIFIRKSSWRRELFQRCKKKGLSHFGVDCVHSMTCLCHSCIATSGCQYETLPQSKTCHFLWKAFTYHNRSQDHG